MAESKINRYSSKSLHHHRGETKTLKQWAESAGIRPDTLSHRLRRGWTFDKAIELPLGAQPNRSMCTKRPEYNIWARLVQRCSNPRNPGFPRYGARGIIVCQRWRNSADCFIEDMGPRPSPQHSTERIDNDGNYSCGKCEQCLANGWPANCYWATASEQARNKRNTIRITIDGETKDLQSWCDQFGIHRETVLHRIKNAGWSVQDALKIPPNKHRRPKSKLYLYKGELKYLSEHAAHSPVQYQTVVQRLKKGWSIERAIETPHLRRRKQDTQTGIHQ